MTPHVVADVGNSRIKWGLCVRGAVIDGAGLSDDIEAWERQLADWRRRHPEMGTGPLRWALASVMPARRERLVGWLRTRGDEVLTLDRAAVLPLRVGVEKPDAVGIDRLLDAVAARSRSPGRPAILIDAGSAVTVDWLDADGAFQGGAIFPGVRLMAEALHAYTALLPLVTVTEPVPVMPGRDTAAAIGAGIFGAVVGGIEALARQLAVLSDQPPVMYLTGGDAPLLAPALDRLDGPPVLWPEQTLEGIRVSAEAQP